MKEEVKDVSHSSSVAATPCKPLHSQASGTDPKVAFSSEEKPSQPEDAAQQAAAKQQAVMALQKLFFEELGKGADPNAAAAQALIRLNQKRIESDENVDSMQHSHDSIHVRPPTPLIGGPRGHLSIRVGQLS
jgi:hypothetical protein